MPIKTLAQIEILINQSQLGHTNLHQQHNISAKASLNHLSKQHRHAIYAKKATEEHPQHYYHDQDKLNSTDFAPCLFCSHRKSLFRTITPSSGHTKHHDPRITHLNLTVHQYSVPIIYSAQALLSSVHESGISHHTAPPANPYPKAQTSAFKVTPAHLQLTKSTSI